MEAMSNSIVLNEEGEHTMGQNVYSPRYPVYNFNNPGDQSNAPTNQQFNNAAQSYGFSLPAATSSNESEKKDQKLL